MIFLCCASCGIDISDSLEKINQQETPCSDATVSFYSAKCYWTIAGEPVRPEDFNSECMAYWEWIENADIPTERRNKCKSYMDAWLECVNLVSGGSTCSSCDDIYDSLVAC
jgi:hypothetical protein